MSETKAKTRNTKNMQTLTRENKQLREDLAQAQKALSSLEREKIADFAAMFMAAYIKRGGDMVQKMPDAIGNAAKLIEFLRDRHV